MKATEAKLLEFLKKSPQFVIPIYQRTYSWTERECRQLWDDILRTGRNDKVSAALMRRARDTVCLPALYGGRDVGLDDGRDAIVDTDAPTLHPVEKRDVIRNSGGAAFGHRIHL